MRIVFMGTPLFAVASLKALVENSSCEVVGVVTQPDRPKGRGKKIMESPVKVFAQEHGLPVLQPEKVKNPDSIEALRKLNPELIVVAAFGQFLPESILTMPKYGCINVHASLLPKLRGGAPIHKAIIDGYTKTGITIMYMDKKMDNGDIISTSETEILDSDNLESLHDRLSIMGRDLLLKTLPSIIEGTNKRIKQNEDEVTYAYNIKREEEHINLNKTRREVFNQIRGLSPVPGANLLIDGEEFKIYGSEISERKFTNKEIGEVTGLYKEGIGVMTLDGEIILTDIKPFGKKRMSASSYINGLHDKSLVGKVLS